jgi:hypothetical protein
MIVMDNASGTEDLTLICPKCKWIFSKNRRICPMCKSPIPSIDLNFDSDKNIKERIVLQIRSNLSGKIKGFDWDEDSFKAAILSKRDKD